MLEVKDLVVAYGPRTILKQVSFNLEDGCILALIGPNGAGKSTLIRTLTGLVAPRSGTMQLDGRDLAGLSNSERAHLMAVVPQARNLPPAFTGWEMVSLGRTPYLNWLGQLSEKDEAIARRAMELTDTVDLADRRIGELSGGEQQRLLLARALAQAAPVLLLDEPTTHLDLQHQLNILDRLRRLAHPQEFPRNGSQPLVEKLSALVVLHDLNLAARFADRVGLLVDGELRALGTPAEVLTAETLSSAYHVPIDIMFSTSGGRPIILPHAA